MGLFDALTGAASAKAAKNNLAAISQGITAGSNALGTGATNAIDALGTRGDGNALSALGQGYGQARTDLAGQYGQTQGYLGQLGSSYAPMVQQGSAAYGAYNDAIGANGADGAARATSNFRAAPGYDYTQNQALEAVQRSAAARGGLAGGNATADILKTATGLADQGYQQYVNNLKGGSDFYTTGLAGQGQGLSAQAQASQNQGTALGALGVGQGQNSASLYGKAADVQTGLGQNVAGLWSNATGQLVQNNNNNAQAQNQASANLIGLGKSALGGLFDFAGGGGTLSSLAGIFR